MKHILQRLYSNKKATRRWLACPQPILKAIHRSQWQFSELPEAIRTECNEPLAEGEHCPHHGLLGKEIIYADTP